ncbi:alpha-(1,3)-fucosyltransferase C-like [Mytilus californianus]|uniref:alpha-(1,3)-fucosyltransferase C-like n=1 Tax=Mytilus californianus TaxID=6549 RepID=UPI0022480C36|nr:alpha-(1,3)-fucosyltransferase C-like [Mytilus californianus]
MKLNRRIMQALVAIMMFSTLYYMNFIIGKYDQIPYIHEILQRLMYTYPDNKLSNGMKNITSPFGKTYVAHNCTRREYVFDNTANISSNDNTIPTIFMYEKHPLDWFTAFNIKDKGCTTCLFTSDSKFYNMSKVVIFFRTLIKPPPEKLAGQIWVYFTNESPTYMVSPTNIAWTKSMSKFDWVMSYRPGSDIIVPFGVLTKKENRNKLNYTKIFKEKKKEIAWIVSHCETNSKRKEYVKELQKYIQVDIYGGCGNLSCQQQHPVKISSDLNICKSYISQNYKFYLSFENSLCNNYVSEKVYDIFEDDNMMLPVIRGAPNIASVLPDGTFITTSNFTSPKQLAAFLAKIGSSEKEYTSYLKKKHSYSVTNWAFNFKTAICDLCTRIKNEKLVNKKINVYDRLKEDRCFKPSDIIHE